MRGKASSPCHSTLSLTVNLCLRTLIESVELVLVCSAQPPPLSHQHPVSPVCENMLKKFWSTLFYHVLPLLIKTREINSTRGLERLRQFGPLLSLASKTILVTSGVPRHDSGQVVGGESVRSVVHDAADVVAVRREALVPSHTHSSQSASLRHKSYLAKLSSIPLLMFSQRMLT